MRYKDDWVGFVREVLKVDVIEPYQEKILLWVQTGERQISVVSGHGIGKTAVASWCIICFLMFRYPQKTVITSPSEAQLDAVIIPEVKKWMRKMPPALVERYELLSKEVKLKGNPDESFTSFRVARPENPEALAGVHSENVFLIADEASGVAEEIFESAEGSMSSEGAITLLLGNPVRSSGFFFNTQHKWRDEWKTLHVSCLDSKRVTDKFVESVKKKYGELSNQFRVRVLGLFPKADDDTKIPIELLELATEKEIGEPCGVVVLGGDVAGGGSDSTTLCIRQGKHILGKILQRRGYDTMQVVGWYESEYRKLLEKGYEVENFFIDTIGIGGGVVSRLQEKGYNVTGVNVSNTPINPEKFLNLRAELWDKALAWLLTKEVSMPIDPELREELVAVKLKYSSQTGKEQIESTESIKSKKRLGRSPDKAVSFVLTFTEYDPDRPTFKRKPLLRVIKGIV